MRDIIGSCNTKGIKVWKASKCFSRNSVKLMNIQWKYKKWVFLMWCFPLIAVAMHDYTPCCFLHPHSHYVHQLCMIWKLMVRLKGAIRFNSQNRDQTSDKEAAKNYEAHTHTHVWCSARFVLELRWQTGRCGVCCFCTHEWRSANIQRHREDQRTRTWPFLCLPK